MAEMGNLLTQQMAGVAAEVTATGMPTTFADPRSRFRGKRIRTIHGIVVDKTPGDLHEATKPSGQSFHPKIDSGAVYAEVLNATLGSGGHRA